MDRLIVKNFGPLKDVDIELNKINLFIGENGSGKSILGKILTIILNSFVHENTDEKIKQNFKNYNIDFIENVSYIKYIAQNKTSFILKNNEFKSNLHSPILLTAKMHFDEHKETLKDIETANVIKSELEENMGNPIRELEKTIFSLNEFKDDEKTALMLADAEKLLKSMKKEMNKNVDIVTTNKTALENLSNLHKESLKTTKPILTSQYIPAERNLIALFNKSLTTLLVAEVPLPKFLLHFTSEFEKAGNELKELEFLNVKYINGDGLDRHKVYFNDDDYLPLEQSSSGIQSALPLYLTVKYFAKKHHAIIIEEPEQNLFPKAQAQTIKYIVEQVSDKNSLFMMTHSPYVLSTLNNLLYAYVVAQVGEKEKAEVKELIDERQWINPDEFSAYYLENGVARGIKSDIGLIADNEIDNISEEMGEEFDELLEIYRASKND